MAVHPAPGVAQNRVERRGSCATVLRVINSDRPEPCTVLPVRGAPRRRHYSLVLRPAVEGTGRGGTTLCGIPRGIDQARVNALPLRHRTRIITLPLCQPCRAMMLAWGYPLTTGQPAR